MVLEDPATDLRLSFRLEDWQVQPVAGELVGPGGAVQHLEPKVMDVLIELARAYPEVLEREDAIQAVWGSRPVADDGLARCVTLLRQALGDSRAQPRYIQTVPKRGYRLLVPPLAVSSSPQLVDAREENIEDWSGPTEFDNLKVIRLLGRGSMGVVHLAQEVNLERLVAVKTLRGIIAGDERANHRFRREASAAARIDHPNVTSIFRLGELADGTPYIVMQYIRGRTLSALMASSGEISEDIAIAIVRQIAAGIAAAHRERVVHRDVKPANVLIEQDSNLAILSDFGIAGILETGARIATRLTLHGEMLGDSRYVSPEQARGDAPTPASDIYSLAVVAYELLTGVYPFANGKSGTLPQLTEQARPMSKFKHGINPALEHIVMQSLARVADERPSAEQFLAELDGKIRTPDESGDSSPSSLSLRSKIAAVLVLVVVAVLVVVLLVTL